MNSFLKLLILLSSCFTLTANLAQTRFTDNLHVLSNVHRGYNLPEYSFLNTVTTDYINSLEVCLYKKSSSVKNNWSQLYQYPEYGISLFYTTLGNDSILGREVALTYFFRTSILTRKKFNIYSRFGIGLSYVNRKFDLEDNYLNVAVGSNVNIHFNARLGFRYNLSNRFGLNLGLSFNHFSNANSSEPNLGINYLTGYTGVSYSFNENLIKKDWQLENHNKFNYLHLFASIGGKRARSLLSKFFITSSLSAEYNRAFFKKVHLGVGADLFWDSSIKPSLEVKYEPSNSFQTGVHISQSIIYNRFTFSLQEGVYLILKEKVDGYRFYNRGLVQYQVNGKLAIRIAMKSHLHILDYPEIGFGYKF